MGTRHHDKGQGGSDRRHWESVYAGGSADRVSWYQAEPSLSLQLIERAGPGAADPIIDIGGGASVLADRLLDSGYMDITVLDVSAASISAANDRLGERARQVEWLRTDIREFTPARQYALWHDRALFHFMTRTRDRRAYVRALREAVPPGQWAIIATFAIGGPKRCSGLDIVQYDTATLTAELGEDFRLEDHIPETHVTPAGSEQLFTYFSFRRT